MKFILTILAGLFLLLSIITGIFNKFRPQTTSSQKWKVIGFYTSLIFMTAMISLFAQDPSMSNINKIVIPVLVFIVFFDIYRRRN